MSKDERNIRSMKIRGERMKIGGAMVTRGA
jgi:hypothetical protein